MPVPFDKHTIDTPEQLQLEFAVAGVGSRFLALALDTLIQFGVGLVVFIAGVVFLTTTGFAGGPRAPIWVVGGMLLFLFIVNFGYFAFFEVLWNGQTPGKRKVGIRVVKDSGRPLSTPETIGRNLMRIVDSLPGFYAIGLICALTNSRSQRLGDLVVGSLVVRETREGAAMPVWQSSAEPVRSFEGSSLTLDQLRVIEAFLARRSELNEDVRRRVAHEVWQKVHPEGMALGVGVSYESALEELARVRRGQ